MISFPHPHDPALDGLDTLLDNSAMAEVLSQHLPECASGALRLLSCTLLGWRYKPARSCRARYELVLADTETGSTIKTLAHARLYGDRRAQKLWSEPSLGRLVECAARLHPDPPLGRAAYIPQMGAIVQLYPVDVDLPALVRAASSSEMCRLLREALPEGMGVALEGCHPELVRYKSTHRATLRYGLEGGEVDVVYGKLRRDERGAVLLKVGRALVEAGVPTPAPLVYLPELRMVVHAEAPGMALSELRESSEYEAWLEPVAEALARLHATRVANLPTYPTRREAETILAMRQKIGRLLPELATEVDRLARSLAADLDAAAGPQATIHGDFHDRQVLVSEAGVVLLDFDGTRLGNPASDVGNFLAGLTRRKGPFGAADEARAIFLDAYAALRTDACEHALLFEAVSFLRSAIGPFRRLRPDWPTEIERMVRLSAQRLEEYRRRGRSLPSAASRHAL